MDGFITSRVQERRECGNVERRERRDSNFIHDDFIPHDRWTLLCLKILMATGLVRRRRRRRRRKMPEAPVSRNRRPAGRHHLQLTTSLQRRWLLRWLLLPAGHRGHQAPRAAARCPGGRTGTDPLLRTGHGHGMQSGIPCLSPPSVAASLSGSHHPDTEPSVKRRGPKEAAKGRAGMSCQERGRSRTPRHSSAPQHLPTWFRVSAWKGPMGALLRCRQELRKPRGCVHRGHPCSSLTTLTPKDRHVLNRRVGSACGQDPGLWRGDALEQRPCTCVGLNCKTHMDQTVTERRGESGNSGDRVHHPPRGTALLVQGTTDIGEEAQTSVLLSCPQQVPRNPLLTPGVSDKRLTELIHEFLQDFHKKYGSLIPLKSGDVLNHLRQKVKSDLSGRMALIREEVGRYEASFTTAPPPCFTVTYKKHTLTLDDLTTLESENWVNDQVINMYGELIMEAVDHEVHFFNSFFYRQLVTKGYEGVKRWTKNVDLFSKTLLLVPIHVEVHWCLVSVDLLRSSIQLYDSQGFLFKQAMENILEYIMTESREKQKTAFERSWTMIVNKWIPQQRNDSDCGVFVLEYCKRLALGRLLKFSQADMPSIRKRIYKELCECELLH
ncbi:sentrin-specific protease 3-like [Arapaima gigas]